MLSSQKFIRGLFAWVLDIKCWNIQNKLCSTYSKKIDEHFFQKVIIINRKRFETLCNAYVENEIVIAQKLALYPHNCTHTNTHTHTRNIRTHTVLTFCRMYCKIPSMDSRTTDFACQRMTHYPMINLTKKHMLTFLCANLLHDIETALGKWG